MELISDNLILNDLAKVIKEKKRENAEQKENYKYKEVHVATLQKQLKCRLLVRISIILIQGLLKVKLALTDFM